MSYPVAIITGAGRGIGRATAVRLAKEGYVCVGVSRSKEDVAETARLCGGDSLGLVGDVCEPRDVVRVVESVEKRFGRIDVLINNAGYAPLIPFEQMNDSLWEKVIQTNLTGTYRFSRAVWPTMLRQKGGAIVNVSSEASRDPFEGFSAYGSAKAGINLFTRALAREGDRAGIRVYCVAPAGVETGMLRQLLTVEQLPPEHVLSADDVANVILSCICGDLRHTSGETIYLHRRI